MADRPLYPVCRTHLDEMSVELGVWQHADGRVPNEKFGYCTDDVARALKVDLLHARQIGWEAVAPRAWQRLRFLQSAFNRRAGRFHNFRSARGEWLDDVGSEDAHARALAALGLAVAEAHDETFRVEAARLFELALPAASDLVELRPIAASVLGCVEAGRQAAREAVGFGDDPSPIGSRLAQRLAGSFAGSTRRWPWPSPALTYENALLPLALFVAGSRLDDRDMLVLAATVLDWLADRQTTADGHFSAVGNKGWWPSEGIRAQFDQQPIDAAVMVEAAAAAFDVTGYQRYRNLAESAYGWFLGDNDLGVPLADPGIGACHDGLTPRGPNANFGAESTLSWLIALERIRELRGRGRSGAGVQATAAARSAPSEIR